MRVHQPKADRSRTEEARGSQLSLPVLLEVWVTHRDPDIRALPTATRGSARSLWVALQQRSTPALWAVKPGQGSFQGWLTLPGSSCLPWVSVPKIPKFLVSYLPD